MTIALSPPKTDVGVAPDATQTPPSAQAAAAHPRRVGRVVLVVAAVIVVVIVGALTARAVLRPPELAVTAARVSDVSRMLAVTGRVEAERDVRVSPQSAGRLTELIHFEGESVKAGEVLARLDDVNAKSAVLQQRASLASRRSDLSQAQRDLARTESLLASGAVPIAEVEIARLAVSRAVDDVARLAAVLRGGESQLVLVAPFAGTIVKRDGELGQIVGPETAVFQIATTDASRVSAEVDERYVRVLRRGMKAEILPVGTEDTTRAAKVSYVAQAVDPQTGAATVRFVYDIPPADALVGMSVDINVSVQQIRGALVIPRASVGGVGLEPFVLVVISGRVERRLVVVDDWPAAQVVVRSGLKEGDLVALDPKSATANAKVRAKVVTDDL